MTIPASSVHQDPLHQVPPAFDKPAFDKPAFDKRAFRNALGSFVTGVTIITTCDEAGQHAGLTANSFNSVSLDPPMVLWSLALDSTSLAAFRGAQWWAVHVLAAGQEALSNQFAQREGDKFEGVRTSPGPGGIPLLESCAARFICRAAFEYEGGDHAIFLGAVHAFEHSAHTPLIYHKGSYGGVFPAYEPASRPASLEAMERLGLIERPAGRPALTREGSSVAEGFIALAEDEAGSLTRHELSALRHLMARLSPGG